MSYHTLNYETKIGSTCHEQNEPMSNLFIITGQNLFAKGVTKGIYISEDI